MIFLGDIAVPTGIIPKINSPSNVFVSQAVANLEGAIVSRRNGWTAGKKLFNDSSVIAFLQSLNVKVVALANNHILDVNPSPAETIQFLKDGGIEACGAGENIEEAGKPVLLRHGNEEYVFLAFGWETIQCVAASRNRPGMNPLRPKHMLKSVRQTRQSYPDAKFILLAHWNYELEIFPQPMHRQLAFAAVDAGADAVIGCHSHCVQGIEVYHDAPIVHCLGNWFLPHNVFFNGWLSYPDFTLRQIAFEWDSKDNGMICHWFEYQPDNHEVTFIKSEELTESQWIEELTPYRNMDREDYASWFRLHRRKRILLPVYTQFDQPLINWVKDRWVQLRQMLISLIYVVGLKAKPK